MTQNRNPQDIHITLNAVIVAMSILLISLLTWSLNVQYTSIIDRLNKHDASDTVISERLANLDKLTCSTHPAKCEH